MKSYCTFSIRLNRLKKGSGTTGYILFIFFPKAHFNWFFFLSSLCALSSFSVEAWNELGLRFAVGNAGVVVVAWACRSRRGGGLGLPILRISAWVCRSRPRLSFSLPAWGISSLPSLFLYSAQNHVNLGLFVMCLWEVWWCIEVWWVLNFGWFWMELVWFRVDFVSVCVLRFCVLVLNFGWFVSCIWFWLELVCVFVCWGSVYWLFWPLCTGC